METHRPMETWGIKVSVNFHLSVSFFSFHIKEWQERNPLGYKIINLSLLREEH